MLMRIKGIWTSVESLRNAPSAKRCTFVWNDGVDAHSPRNSGSLQLSFWTALPEGILPTALSTELIANLSGEGASALGRGLTVIKNAKNG